jgi:hypothetical protein
VEQAVDRITGIPVSSARLATHQVSNGAIAFPPPAEVQLTCFRDEPLVRIAFGFKVGSNRNSTLGYRFDDKPGREADARFLQDYRTVVIEEDEAVAQFVRELAASQVLYVRIRSLNSARTSAEFRVEGAGGAIENALAGCPVKSTRSTADARARPRSARR